MSKSKSKSKQKKRVIKSPSSKGTASSAPSEKETKPLDPKFIDLMEFSGNLSHIADYIHNRESVTVDRLQEHKVSKTGLLDDLKEINYHLDEQMQKAKEIKNEYSGNLVQLAKEALIILEIIFSIIDSAYLEIYYFDSKKDKDLLFEICLRAYKRANEHRCELEKLSGQLWLEANEYFSAGDRKEQKEKRDASYNLIWPGEARALVLLKAHPDWSNKQIAEVAKVHPKSLSRWKTFKSARRIIQEEGKQKFHIGRKSKNGDIEAED